MYPTLAKCSTEFLEYVTFHFSGDKKWKEIPIWGEKILHPDLCKEGGKTPGK